MRLKILATIFFVIIAVVSVVINIWLFDGLRESFLSEIAAASHVIYELGKGITFILSIFIAVIFLEDKFTFDRPIKNLLIACLFYAIALYAWGLMSGIFFTIFEHPHPAARDWLFAIYPLPFAFILGGFISYPLPILSFWLFGKYWACLRNKF